MVEEIRRTAQRRLRQIQPLIEEAERLRDVLAALDRKSGTGAASAAERGANRVGGSVARGRHARGAAHPRAARGSNKRTIIELVGHEPGITPSQISAITGMKRTVVASTVSRLKRYGELCDRDGGGLQLSEESATPAHVAARREQQPGASGLGRTVPSLPRRRAA